MLSRKKGVLYCHMGSGASALDPLLEVIVTVLMMMRRRMRGGGDDDNTCRCCRWWTRPRSPSTRSCPATSTGTRTSWTPASHGYVVQPGLQRDGLPSTTELVDAEPTLIAHRPMALQVEKGGTIDITSNVKGAEDALHQLK